MNDSLANGHSLTPLQSGMLFHWLATPSSGVDIEQLVCRSNTLLDCEKLEGTFAKLLEVHPILTTRFHWQDGVSQATQRLVEGVRVPLEQITHHKLAEFLAEDRKRGFDLSKAPMLRASVLEDGQYLVLTFHHALLDGRCFPVLLDDLFRFIEGKPPSEPISRRPFSDYVDWINHQDFAQSESFWRERLTGFSAPTPLVVDDISVSDNDLTWQSEITVSAGVTSKLEGLAKAAGVTMNTITQAAWAILLGKYSGEDDVVFGGTRACRKSTIDGAEDMLGLFINTLPVRASVSSGTLIKDLFRELREQWVAMRPHEHTPLGMVQGWSDVPAGEPLFQSILVFENFDLNTRMKRLGGEWETREVTLYEKTNFPITVAAYLEESLRIKIEYDPGKFDLPVIELLLGHLRHLLEQMADDSNRPLGDLALSTPAEVSALRGHWAPPTKEASVKRTLVSWFEDQAAQFPERMALAFEKEQLTYNELNERANQLGRYLQTEHQVGTETIVGLCVERSPNTVIGILGILKAGGAYLPIDLAYPKDRLQWMLEDSGTPVLLTQESLLGQVPEVASCAVVSLDTLPRNADRAGQPNPHRDTTPDSLAYVIFTSGSTGKPKGVQVTHANVVRLMEQTEAWFGFDENDVWTLFHSFAFDFSVWEIWGALLYGGKLVVVPFDVTRTPESFHLLLAEESVTVLNQTPSAFRQLIQADAESPRRLTSLRYVIFGGEALELASLKPWFDHYGDTQPQLVNMYGITETTVHVTYRPIHKEDLKSGSVIGEPIPDLEIHLLDPQGHPVPVGVPGEIHVGGGGLARGYLNRPDLTAERFAPHPYRPGKRLYRTGDVARFLLGNDLEYLGRCDEQVKIRGFRIELGEIQSVLCQHSTVYDALVCVREDRLVAYVIASERVPTVAELRQHSGRQLPPYMVPAAFVFLDEFHLTNNGKIDRQALPEPSTERISLGARFSAPRNKTETTLTEIWSRVLRVDKVGIHDDYFELGGDSILSIQIVSQARAQGLAITPRHLFDHRTIAELADAASSLADTATPEVSTDSKPAPVTPIQHWFHELDLPNPHHWNQAFLFELKSDVDPKRLEEAFANVAAHHEALRLRFDDGSTQQPAEPAISFEAADSPYSLNACEDAQRSLHIEKGPLFAAILFSDQHLFIAIHHLIIDGVSWQILLEDLEAHYHGSAPHDATAPFTAWAHRQQSLSESPEILKQLGHWHKLSKDFTITDKALEDNTVASAGHLTASLETSETQKLLKQVPAASRAQINELLLAALAQALSHWTGHTELAIDLEGHGREDALGLDVSRTIGWFTSIFPVSLSAGRSLSETLIFTKAALREMPMRGFGYGLLKRWGHLEDHHRRDVVFNYLGQFDQVVRDSELFAFSNKPSGCWYDARGQRPYLIEINAWIREGCLEFRWTYSKRHHTANAVQEVADHVLASLRTLIADASQPNPRYWSTLDFPLAPSGSNIHALCQEHHPETVEDITGLAPLQQLYFTLETARPGSGIDQWHWELEGPLDPERLREAWQTVVQRHSTLRSSYHGAHTVEPVQIIHRKVDVELHQLDWINLPAGEQQQKFDAFLKVDANNGLPIQQAPLMRLTLIRIAKDRYRFVWTHHHLQIDGWSWPIVLGDVARAYDRDPAMQSRAISFSKHLTWLGQWNESRARQFWTQELAAFSHPTPLPGKAESSSRFDQRECVLSEFITVRLKDRASKEGVTLNALMQTALGVLLARQAGSNEAVFGASFSGRPGEIPGVEEIVGAFVSNVPVRIRLESDDNLPALLHRVNLNLITLAEQQYLPLTEIQRCSEVPLRMRLFETLLVFQNYTVHSEAMTVGSEVQVTNFTAPVRTNYPLTLTVKAGDTIKLCAIYQEVRFDSDYIERFLQAYGRLLEQFTTNDHIPVDIGLPLIEPANNDAAPRRGTLLSPRNALETQIAAVWQEAFGHDRIGVEDNFFDLGGHSLLLVQVHRLLKSTLKRDLTLVDVFRNPTIASLAQSLSGTNAVPSPSGVRGDSQSTDIAIIGMSGHFPGAESVEAFWENLVNGVECLTSVTNDSLRNEGLDPEALETVGDYVSSRGLVDDPAGFDAAFFEITPKEAEATDPQQRRFLELAWAALEDAGYVPSTFPDRIGVFAGMSNNTYHAEYVQADSSLREALGNLTVMMGNEKDYLATRTAYKLNLSGPALSLYTACSTSLVAVAEAIYALREGRCEIALAGAVSLTFPFKRGYYYEDGGITSPDGHCRPFDEMAAGTVFSNGMGAVILKPLKEALAAGDQIHAVIKGVGLNNDGSNKVSFTAPSVEGQAGAIAQAQREAGFSAETIGYVEAHGTGTTLGDPIEVEALTLAFRQSTTETGFCKLGSVKSNIGHLDAAAGMAGLIKAALTVKHGIIPATLHARRPNPSLRLTESPFQLATSTETWETNGAPRRVGVSSFGVGGTNAHVVMEEPPPREPASPCPRTVHLLPLSAKTPEALTAMCRRLADHLTVHPDIDLADVAYTLQTGRETFACRTFMVASSVDDAVRQLREETKLVMQANVNLPVAFLFPGQGAQFGGMGHALYEKEPPYRDLVNHAAEVLQPLLEGDIREVMFAEADPRLTETRFTQPALFVTSYAMAKLWQTHGVMPDRMIGHSVGEYTAACLSGVLEFDDALRLVAQRAQLVQAQPAGAMLAIRLPEAEVRPLLREGIDLAALNSPKMTVVAGSFETIEAFEEHLKECGVASKRLRTSHAFHSCMMEPVLEPFEAILSETSFGSPHIPYVSNVTGTWVTDDETSSPPYWASHVRQAVRFADGLQCLAESSTCVFLEVGPGQSLTSFARHTFGRGQGAVASLPDKRATGLADALGNLWSSGGKIDWQIFYSEERRHRVSLPAYPFQHVTYLPNRCLAEPQERAPTIIQAQTVDRTTNVLSLLQDELHSLSGMPITDLDPQASFLELGFDSLFLGQASAALSKRFGVKITFRSLMEELDTISSLAAHLDQELPPDQFAPEPSVEAPQTSNASTNLESRMSAVEQALEKLQPGILGGDTNERLQQGFQAGNLHQTSSKAVSYGPFRPLEKAKDGALTETQKAHLSDLITRYTQRTAGSRAHTQKHREQLADPRAAAGFNPLWKDMVYPIVTKRSQGARLWDIDDNEWIDITHGFGLGLFGHRPDFLIEAVEKQLAEGFEIGPSSPLAGEVAAMLCEVSGKERVTFCNTGSEAVMAAIRVARTASQKSLIAAFAGSYHGIFDEVLGRPLVRNGDLATVPIAPGIPEEYVSQILLLEYGHPESLEFIERYRGDLAAVLVEPVQSRRPDLQPRAFLKDLRAVTAKHDIALVFDEVVTGFRSHPKGAQALFGIDADLVTYGKVLGGGIPIGALAGRARYMDALDGGSWQYGDDSGPEASVTFFAGTFVRHPLALAAAQAVLTKITESGPTLQETLDARTAGMVAEMNRFCEDVHVPLRVTRFSSMYYFNFAPELRFSSLFFYHLRLRGIHAWETRPSFLSLAHSEEDIEAILKAFRETVTELQQGGFFPKPLVDEELSSFALTEAQQELFLASQLHDDACRACNEALTIDLKGALDVERLKQAIERLIDRHESLRTVFADDGSMQTVKSRSELRVDIRVTDIQGDPNRMNRRCDEVQETLFDLTNGPLVRFEIFVLGKEHHAVLMAGHHLIVDGWSFDLLYHQLGQAYADIHQLPATPFRIYAEQSRSVDSETETYWLDQYRDTPPTLALPRDTVSGSQSPYRAGSVRRRSAKGFAKRLRACCQRWGITPYVFMLAAYRELLGRLSGLNESVVGAPIAGQAASELEGLCGHGVQFLPMRFHRDDGATIETLLKETRRQVLDAMEHQRFTLGELTKRVAHERRHDHQGLVATTFTLEPLGTPYTFDGIEASLHLLPKRYLSFDLSVFILAEEDAFTVACNYSASKFQETTITRWLGHYFILLESLIAAEPNQPTHTLEILSNDEKQTLLVDWNASALACPTPKESVVDLFEEQVSATPEATAVVSESENLTYWTLNSRANALAKTLIDQGVDRGDRVALFAHRSPETMVALVAILKAGAAYVPVDPDYPEERIAWMLEDTTPPVILTQRRLRDRLGVLSLAEATVLEIDASTAGGEDTVNPGLSLGPEDLAYIIYTSGSTGRPKGVCVPHRGITRLVTKPNYMSISPSDVFLQEATISFDASTLELWGPLLNGATLALPPAGLLTVDGIKEAIEKFGVTNLWLTAGLFQLIMDEQPSALKPLRQLLAGGDVLGKDQVRVALRTLPAALINGYGPTENTTFTTCHRIREEDLDLPSIPIGKPINGTSVYILDDYLQPVPMGVAGELYTGGDGLALGYLNHPNLTKEKFIPHPFSDDPDAKLYRIGDRCRFLPDGTIEFLGRVDHQVKVRGFRIELAEVERTLTSFPGASQAKVITRGENSADRHLAAFLVSDNGALIDKPALDAYLKAHLPPYMIPTTIVVLKEFPLNANGKIDTARLPTADRNQATTTQPPHATSEMETRLLKIWQEILGRNGFSIHESFFDLGGHSLLGLRLFARLQKEIGYRAPLATLFSNPTVHTLAKCIEQATAAPQPPSLVARIKPTGSRPPLVCIHGGDGGILFYRDLANKLHADQPMLAIESPALFDTTFDLTSITIPSLSDHYISLIKQAEPRGPYFLGGYSFGGIMAYELACRLRNMGEEVALLVLFDTANPAHEQERRYTLPQRIKARWEMNKQGSIVERIGALAKRFTTGLANKSTHKATLQQLKRLYQEGNLNDPESRVILLNEIHEQATISYEPETYDGDAVLLRTPVANDRVAFTPDLGWSGLIKSLQIIEVAGSHLELFKEPCLSELAKRLNQELSGHLFYSDKSS